MTRPPAGPWTNSSSNTLWTPGHSGGHPLVTYGGPPGMAVDPPASPGRPPASPMEPCQRDPQGSRAWRQTPGSDLQWAHGHGSGPPAASPSETQDTAVYPCWCPRAGPCSPQQTPTRHPSWAPMALQWIPASNPRRDPRHRGGLQPVTPGVAPSMEADHHRQPMVGPQAQQWTPIGPRGWW